MLLIYCFLFVSVAMGTMVEETYSDVTEVDQSPQLNYQSTETIINPVFNSSNRAVMNILKQLYKFDSSEQKTGI